MELIFKMICCSAVFIGFYHLVLQREKMFRFNRIYLLVTLVLTFTIPFMELGFREIQTVPLEEFLVQSELPKTQINPAASVQNTISVYDVPSKNALPEAPKFEWNWIQLLLGMGIFVSLILLVRFILNLIRLRLMISKNERVSKDGFTLVKIDKTISPYSFFTYLFVSKDELEKDEIRSEIFYHEWAHIHQKHSWDVLFIEFLLIFFWFNPFLFLYRKSITINHEFLADEEVLSHEFDTKKYQHLLLEKIPVRSQTQLSSSFNYLVTKKRLIMMTKQTSKLKTNALKFFSIPLLALVMFTFSEKVSAQIEPGKGVSKELFREYQKQVRKATVKVKNQDGTHSKKIDTSKLDGDLMAKIYDKISYEQKLKSTPIPSVKKSKVIKIGNGEDLVLNFDDLKFDELAFGMDAADMGLKIADDVLRNMDFKDLEKFNVEYFESPEWEAKIAEIEKNAAEIERYYDSPEWKTHIEKIEKNAEEIERYYNSPEWKQKIEKIERNAEEIERYYNSPEWKSKMDALEKNAMELEKHFNSEEWKSQVKELEKAALEAEKAAIEAEKAAREAQKASKNSL